MPKSVLIVDDEAIIRNVLQRKLEQTTTYNVHTADDGDVGLEIFKQEKVDLVITDLLMPRMNGIEMLRELKGIEPGVPVIIITGYGTLEDAIEAIHLGAEDFITKPFDINHVLETIDKTFRKLAEETDQREVIKFIANENIQLEVPTNIDLLNTVINYIFSHLKARWLVSDEDLHDVKVCLYEALTNAFEHGNLGISGTKKNELLKQSQQAWREYLVERCASTECQAARIHIRLEISEEQMAVTVRDEGSGFDHRSRMQETDTEEIFRVHGRGLLLIQSLMDELEFSDAGNQLKMIKHRIHHEQAEPPG